MNILIAVTLVFFPLVALGIIIRKDILEYSLYLTIFLIYTPSVVVLLSIQKAIRKSITSKAGPRRGGLISMALMGVFNIIYILAIYEISKNVELNHNPIILLKDLAAPFLFLLIIIWLGIHSVIFIKQPNELQALHNEIKAMDNPSMGIQTILNKSPNLLDNNQTGFFQNYAHLFASFSIIIVVVCVEIGLINILTNDNSITYPISAKYLA